MCENVNKNVNIAGTLDLFNYQVLMFWRCLNVENLDTRSKFRQYQVNIQIVWRVASFFGQTLKFSWIQDGKELIPIDYRNQ